MHSQKHTQKYSNASAEPNRQTNRVISGYTGQRTGRQTGLPTKTLVVTLDRAVANLVSSNRQYLTQLPPSACEIDTHKDTCCHLGSGGSESAFSTVCLRGQLRRPPAPLRLRRQVLAPQLRHNRRCLAPPVRARAPNPPLGIES